MSVFAALEARAVSIALAKLSNATVILGGREVSGRFNAADATSGEGMGMANPQPTLLLAAADASRETLGETFVHGGVTYAVVDREPDGAGKVRLLLEVRP